MESKNEMFYERCGLNRLPLSLAGVTLGIFLASADYHLSWKVVLCVLAAAASLHIFSYGRSRAALAVSVIFSVLSVFFSFGKILMLESLLLLLFAYFIMRLEAGISGRGGNRFFEGLVTLLMTGPVALYGTFYLCSHTMGSWVLVLPSLSIGFLCVAASGLEEGGSKASVSVMTCLGLAFMVAFPFFRIYDLAHFCFVIMIPVYAALMVKMHIDRRPEPKCYLLLFSVSALAVAVLTGLGFVWYLF